MARNLRIQAKLVSIAAETTMLYDLSSGQQKPGRAFRYVFEPTLGDPARYAQEEEDLVIVPTGRIELVFGLPNLFEIDHVYELDLNNEPVRVPDR